MNTVWNGLEMLSYLGPKIWNMVPEEIKNQLSLFSFKRENHALGTRDLQIVKDLFHNAVLI